jgi:hypothetical protein
MKYILVSWNSQRSNLGGGAWKTAVSDTKISLYSATTWFLLPFVLSYIYAGIHPPFSFVNTIVVPIQIWRQLHMSTWTSVPYFLTSALDLVAVFFPDQQKICCSILVYRFSQRSLIIVCCYPAPQSKTQPCRTHE